jgi:hypothetical protein
MNVGVVERREKSVSLSVSQDQRRFRAKARMMRMLSLRHKWRS